MVGHVETETGAETETETETGDKARLPEAMLGRQLKESAETQRYKERHSLA